MLMLVDCSNCHTPLQLPPGARTIRCSICQAITNVAEPRSLPPPPPQHATSSNYYPPPQHPPHVPATYDRFSGHVPASYDRVHGHVPGVNGRKKAVICGISYKGTKNELKGCINDAKCMKYLLIHKFKFPESSILMLTGNTIFFFFFLGYVDVFVSMIGSNRCSRLELIVMKRVSKKIVARD